ncbi:acetyl-CoA hydrolase [Verruconis gallopava]|uniref:Acetyl-CoA hydrolase n=1 Tax=Verruconis gallopava TaxID=253628 RepID=A0A0D2ADB7_9PEZI|nr:acetyl-CoA hydrolase [Verruconis gallopava]KIW04440.1 acetyl-CoA hydrolase [Verruconis gallopava]
MAASQLLKSRVRRPSYLSKLAKAEDLLHLFPNGSYIGWSGFTGVGYPKKVPTALADHVEKHGLQGKLKFNLFVGASSGAETENRWARNDMIERRAPHQVGKDIAKGINTGKIKFFDKHLSMFPVDLMYGFYTMNRKGQHEEGQSNGLDIAKKTNRLDVAIVEASAITEDGGIIPGASVGASPEIIQMAEKIIIEVNTATPSFEGLHDITMTDLPPRRKPYLIMAPEDRIGTPHIPVDPERVVAIVESDYPDQTQPNAPEDEKSAAIATNLIEFLKHEVDHGRLPQNLLPIQSGIGNIANAVIGGLSHGAQFRNLKVWTEVLQDSFLDLFDSGHLDFATATSIRFSPDGFKRFYERWDQYAPKLLLRSQQVSNSPEIIRRLGVIGMNTPVEVDIYAHANSTCVMGSRMLNGLGGSADFLRSAKYSIMHTPSTRPTKTDPNGITCIVPMCTHVDQTEHDLDVVVTEQGLADVRGLSPRERARVIIKNCAHPDYQPILMDYFERAEFECLRKGWGHEPHLLFNTFDLHKNLVEKGTMKIQNWFS